MDAKVLGDAGPRVSRLGLGTAYFGTRITGAMARRFVDVFIDAGGTLIDTADVYGRGVLTTGVADAGASETTVGEAIHGRRDRVVLASKVGQRVIAGPGADKVGLSRTMIVRSVEASLRRLGTDWLDLYQCHLADPATPIDETVGALTDLVAQGKIRYAGVSNWDGWQVADATLTATHTGGVRIVSNQLWYNVLDRQIENSVVPACRRFGVGIVAYSALAQGLLVGGMRRGDPAPKPGTSRAVASGQLHHLTWEALMTPQGWEVLDEIAAVAADHGALPSTVALRWLLDAGSADVALIGPRDEAQLVDFLEAGDATIPFEAFARITAASEPEPTYPRSFTDAYGRAESPDYGGLPDFGEAAPAARLPSLGPGPDPSVRA